MSRLYWSEIRETLDLEAAMAELGIDVQRLVNGEHSASCPLPSHPGRDVNPSFSVNDETCLWNCFTCNEGGGLPKLVQILLELEDDQAALVWLSQFSDFVVDDDEDHAFMEKLQRILKDSELPTWHRRPTLPTISEKVLDRLPEAPMDILAKWNVTDPATVVDFNLRYDEKRVRILNDDSSYTGPALIIPHYFEGNMVGYQERWLEEDRPKALPKYTNTRNFPKKETLFAWDHALDLVKTCGVYVVVVESVMTTIRLWEIGVPSVATFGAGIKPRQMQLLSSLPGSLLAFDNDAAGKKALRTATRELSEKTYVEIIPAPEHEKGDLADLTDAEILSLLSQSKPYTYA